MRICVDKFSVDPGLLSFNLVIPMTILIGNVPLRNFFTNFNQPGATSVPTDPALLLPTDYYPANNSYLPDTDQYPDLRKLP